jgi:dihydrofolate reductase
MSVTASVFIATSLDGFIARPNGSIDWLEEANTLIPEDEDCGYAAFMAHIDVLVMGRNTFDQVAAFDPWPYGDKPVVVLSHRPLALPAHLSGRVTHSSETPAALLPRLSNQGVRRVYVDGGITIQRFLAAGMIDDLTITLIPRLLGQGRPLFGPLAGDVKLQLVGSKRYAFGFVQLQYRVVKLAPAA